MKKFYVINPVLKGSVKTIYECNNSSDAAKEFWNEISKYFKEILPKFFFTLKDDSDKLYHYQVKEMRGDKKDVSFVIEKYETNISNEIKNDFLEISNKVSSNDNFFSEDNNNLTPLIFKKDRKRYKSDSSEKFKDSDLYESDYSDYSDYNKKLNLFWYYPVLYNIETVYTPTFYKVIPYNKVYIPINLIYNNNFKRY